MSQKKSHKSYPQAYKDEAVLMVLEQGYSVADAAKSLGVSTLNGYSKFDLLYLKCKLY
ncbi:hypothetical protein AN944_01640 [Shewanella sp. P1-14-1]|nr:hypothetical protein AN944_01640 [Shewanella sp. P1-14-1]